MIHEDKWFYFASGRSASSIEELGEMLRSMDEAEFSHHVNNERNDFANWVEGVFNEKKLANSMREISDKEGMIIILEDFLKKKKQRKERYEKIRRVIIPQGKKISLEPEKKEEQPLQEEAEKELSEKEIRSIVDEAKQVFEKETEKEEEEKHKAEGGHHHKLELSRFIVKEFIYGFILGLIFGLIMLGVIFNIT